MNEETKRLAEDNMRRVDAWNRAAGERADAIPAEAVETARQAIIAVVGDHLRFNVAAYGTAWTEEDEDTSFIVADAAEKALAAALPFLRAAHPEVGNEEAERLKSECCVCEKCGHVQAEPNWCHECGHRTSMPDWAKPLVDAFYERDELRAAHPEADRAPEGER